MFKHSFRLLTFVASASVAMGSNSAYVKFPSKEVLRESFCNAGFDHFIEKTRILEIVSSQLVPLGVAVRLETELYDYNEDLKKGMPTQRAAMMAGMMEMRKPEILGILFQNDPEALTQLQQNLLSKPTK